MRRTLCLGMVALCLMACREGPTGPTSVNGSYPAVFGNWAGTFQVAGSGTSSPWFMNLVQRDSELRGTAMCATGPYTVYATVTESGQLSLRYGVTGGCQTSLTAQISGNTLSGTFMNISTCSCLGGPNGATGTWSGSRQ
jgi:hypothetical protein